MVMVMRERSLLVLVLWLLLPLLRGLLRGLVGLRQESTGRHGRRNRETSAYPEGELSIGMFRVFWRVAEVFAY